MRQGLILSTGSLLVLLLACGRDPMPPSAQALPAVPVHLAKTAQGQEAGWVAATLTAARQATVSTRMAASVKQVYVNEGQRVAAGTLLVSLADEDVQSGLKAALAAQDAAAAYHRRIAALLKQDAAIPAEMDQADTQLAQAQAAVAQARASLAYTQIRAPFAGTIQARLVEPGAFVGPGTPLVQINGQGDLELDASVSETETRGLRIGTDLAFEADGKTGTAVVTALADGGDPVSHRAMLRARIVKAGADLRTGSFARIKLPEGSGQGPSDPLVPETALVRRGELTGVFVAQGGKAELRWLDVGEPQGSQVPVRAGLRPEDPIIDQPAGLVDGQPIEVRP